MGAAHRGEAQYYWHPCQWRHQKVIIDLQTRAGQYDDWITAAWWYGDFVPQGWIIVNDMPPKDRDVAMVFQNYALYPHYTIYENLAFSLRAQVSSRRN
jgi:hypothetical protein